METFTKRAQAGLLGEAAGLRWLAEAEETGGIHVAQVFFATNTELTEERVIEVTPTREMAQLAGPRRWFALREGGPLWLSQPQFPPVLGRGVRGGAGGRWCGGPSRRGAVRAVSGDSALLRAALGWMQLQCS